MRKNQTNLTRAKNDDCFCCTNYSAVVKNIFYIYSLEHSLLNMVIQK